MAGLCLGLVVALTAPAFAQSGRNVLVVANEASPESLEIAAWYAESRGVPSEQVVRIRTLTSETISRADFERTIQAPIAAAIAAKSLQDQILYIVLTRGVPLRIIGTTGRQGTGASVDSELTLLYRRMVGATVAPSGPVPNPYFLKDRPISEAKPFTRAEYDIYLVTRLDGFSQADAMALIERGKATAGEGSKVVLDDFPLLRDPRNSWIAAAAERLKDAGLGDRLVHDTTTRTVSGVSDVIGYASWGSNDPGLMVRQPDISFAPGAIATMFLSTDARTFAEPPASWKPGNTRQSIHGGSNQSLIGDLIRQGVTGVSGYVGEPYLDSVVRPEILFPAYLSGRNLAESFYLAMPSLGWQAVVVGDPLAAPFRTAATQTDPATSSLNPDTELPVHFSERRLPYLNDPKLYGSSDAVRRWLLRAESRLSRSDQAGAVEALKEAVRLEPGTLQAWRMLGQLHEAANRHEEAVAAYERVLELNPDDVITLNNLAYHLAVRAGKPDAALPLATRANLLAQGSPQIEDTLGWIHHLLGNDREAVPYLVRASRALPRNADVQLHAAVVFAAIGRLEDASKALTAAVAADPAIKERPEYQAVQRKISGR